LGKAVIRPILKLIGARVAFDANRAEHIDLLIHRERILDFDRRVDGATELDFSGHLLLPGLINAHDHLEFGLFPRLGKGPYANASDWARDIYHPGSSPVKEHLAVPKRVRLLWGGIRNLLSGVTTVAHHNPYDAETFNRRFPVRVSKRYGWAHSLGFCPDSDIVRRYGATPSSAPFLIHAAEGTDERANAEVSRLDQLGVLRGRTVLIHAVGATQPQLSLIRDCGASIVWCPSSNLYTLGRTLSTDTLRSGLHLALGTDSPLTAEGDLIDEIHLARTHAGLTPNEIYAFVTTGAAAALRLGEGQGTLRPHGLADLIALRDDGLTPAATLAALGPDQGPELAMIEGRVMLMSDRFASHAAGIPARGLNPIFVEGRGQWLIRADVAGLHAATLRALGSEIRVSGRRICP
jgi:cytosine/adenosine deaminase-related metal-dependent hydrolase